MENLAIIGIIFLCLLSLSLQHLSNWAFRKCLSEKYLETGYGTITIVAFVISLFILYETIYMTIKIF